MKVLRQLSALSIGYLLYCSSAVAQCDGTWQVEFTSAAAQLDSKGQGVWIPAHLSVDRNMQTCAQQLLLRQPQGGSLVLQGQNAMPTYKLMRANRQELNLVGRDHYQLPLQGTIKTDFWVYIPQGKLLTPGRYQGLLDVKLAGATLDEQNWQQHAFEYTVTPYVRVKLSRINSEWIQPIGTSVHINLGDLSLQNQRELPIHIESNTFVAMRVLSKNTGALIHTKHPQSHVLYSMSVAGQDVPLSGEAQLDVAQRPLLGTNVSLTFENKATPYARAGHYEDVVTVSIFAK